MKPMQGKKDNDDDDDDAAAWTTAMRDVRPIARQRQPRPEVPMRGKPAPVPHPRRAPTAPPWRPASTAGIDGGVTRDLRRGKHAIDIKLDLHGMTVATAAATLRRTIARALSDGRRDLLVITGKGDPHKGGGILRQMLPHWLTADSDIAPYILGYAQALPAHGGAGAWYVRLRRYRRPTATF